MDKCTVDEINVHIETDEHGNPKIGVELTGNAKQIALSITNQVKDVTPVDTCMILMGSNIPLAKNMLSKNSQFFSMTSTQRKQWVYERSLMLALNSTIGGWESLDGL